MPRSMGPFGGFDAPWPFLEFGPSAGTTPSMPDLLGAAIPWSMLPPVVPPPASVPPAPMPPAPQPSDPPSLAQAIARLGPVDPPQGPPSPSLVDRIVPWATMSPVDPSPPVLPPTNLPSLALAIARMNAPTPGFHLTPGLGGFASSPDNRPAPLPLPQPVAPPPPLPMPPMGGGLAAMGSSLAPPMPAPSPLVLASSGAAAPTVNPWSGADGAAALEALKQLARRALPYATRLGAAAGAAGSVLLDPWNQQDATFDLGNGLRLRRPLDQTGTVTFEQYRSGPFGIGTWQRLPIDARTTLGDGMHQHLQVDPDQLRSVLGEGAANRVLGMPGILPMAKPPSDERPPRSSGDNRVGKQPSLPPYDATGGSPSNGDGPPGGPDAATAITLGTITAATEAATDPVGIPNIILNSKRGRQFQDNVLEALELPENTHGITVTIDGGKTVTVIPDAQSITLITEVKDVVNLYRSKQFRAYLATNRQINLIVSPNTKTISKPLEELIRRSEGSISIFDPVTKTFTPWNPK